MSPARPAPPTTTPPDAHRRRGILVVLSSPSGAGKTTLAHRLLDEFPDIEFSVSYTTRAPRKNEAHGVDYVFVEPAEFERMAAAEEFAEWAEVHGNRYGTSRTTVERALATGRDVLFDIDWQGGNSLAQKWPEDALRIFIVPPDLATLEARLRGRASDSEQVIRRRLAKALEEMKHHAEYDHVVVNDDLDQAYGVLRAIYLVRRHTLSPARAPYDLPEMAARARDNAECGPEHARALLAEAALHELDDQPA